MFILYPSHSRGNGTDIDGKCHLLSRPFAAESRDYLCPGDQSPALNALNVREENNKKIITLSRSL